MALTKGSDRERDEREGSHGSKGETTQSVQFRTWVSSKVPEAR